MNDADNKFSTGAVRSADTNHLDFASLPLVGLLAVARTAHEGGGKYGRYNYMLGMPVHDLMNHSFRHMTMFLLGDRTEPHLEHAAWGLLAAIQSITLDPHLSEDNLLGPGATTSPAVCARLAHDAPMLAARREAGEFRDSFAWSTALIPEVKAILEQRRSCRFAPPSEAKADRASKLGFLCKLRDEEQGFEFTEYANGMHEPACD